MAVLFICTVGLIYHIFERTQRSLCETDFTPFRCSNDKVICCSLVGLPWISIVERDMKEISEEMISVNVCSSLTIRFKKMSQQGLQRNWGVLIESIRFSSWCCHSFHGINIFPYQLTRTWLFRRWDRTRRGWFFLSRCRPNSRACTKSFGYK